MRKVQEDDGVHHFILLYGLANFMYMMENLEEKNPRNNDGEAPLHMAAEYGYLRLCKYILNSIEEKSPRKNQEWTPLHFAAASGRTTVCKLFMETLEDKFPKNDVGQMPQHLAALQGFNRTAFFLWGFVME